MKGKLHINFDSVNKSFICLRKNSQPNGKGILENGDIFLQALTI